MGRRNQVKVSVDDIIETEGGKKARPTEPLDVRTLERFDTDEQMFAAMSHWLYRRDDAYTRKVQQLAGELLKRQEGEERQASAAAAAKAAQTGRVTQDGLLKMMADPRYSDRASYSPEYALEVQEYARRLEAQERADAEAAAAVEHEAAVAAGAIEATQPFRSQSEIVQAMKDSRYRQDSAYRSDVEARMLATDLNGLPE